MKLPSFTRKLYLTTNTTIHSSHHHPYHRNNLRLNLIGTDSDKSKLSSAPYLSRCLVETDPNRKSTTRARRRTSWSWSKMPRRYKAGKPTGPFLWLKLSVALRFLLLTSTIQSFLAVFALTDWLRGPGTERRTHTIVQATLP